MIILGSRSPRRQELLRLIVPDFEVQPAQIDERALPILPAPEYVASLAAEKGADLAKRYPMATIITADTMVSYQHQLLGKPANRQAAFDTLHMLSGQVHEVYTGVQVLQPKQPATRAVVETKVWFWPLTAAEIEAYLDTNEYRDKAGSYGIQGYGARLVERIDGDFYNVVGLPVSTLARMLRAN
ncbi:Maf family protein [Lacticaseibacillus brantae]|uniref:dTTP/UTP pyrophosphatase n=1 Tax=Lacticaseibacillus brantae DSM 23927 TaxID=1423727 RepID=A0A0R2B5K8_9LACO|nr:Maf family protein [Lacticaseibacillus brantae]KRM71529.1 maf protein [Lacticaseibacillus brantae DSM 23927]